MKVIKTVSLASVVVAITVGVLWITNRPVVFKKATWDDVVAESNMGGYHLIDTNELLKRYGKDPKSTLVVDTRQEWEYRTGHIPGALNFPIEPTWLSRWRKKGDLETFIGPDKDRHVVFYWAGLAWVRSDSAARVAVKLGYRNVYRDPLGYPEWHARGLPVESAPAGLSEATREPRPSGPIHGLAMVWTLIGIFAGGMALNLTPCVYPLIPITVSYFGGRGGKGKGKLMGHGICYIGGLSLTNSVLGVIAALTGGLMGAMLQNPIMLTIVALILVSFATSLFGFWELRLPSVLMQTASKSYAGYLGTLFMGLTLGVVAAPCLGPFVLGLLTWVASMGSPWLGFIVFFTLSLGLGLPLFFLAIFSGHIDKLPRSGEWMLWVKKLMGWVLVGMAAYFIGPVLPKTTEIFLLAAVTLIAGLHLGWIDRTKANFRAFEWIRTGVGIMALVITTVIIGSWVMQGPGVTWHTYSDELLSEVKKLKKPAVIDFYADWCSPCRELEEITFHNAEIVKQAEKDFIMIKIDLTRKGNQVHERLLREYGIKGVPTVVFLDYLGNERRDLRVVDFLPADQFLIRMAEAKKHISWTGKDSSGIPINPKRIIFKELINLQMGGNMLNVRFFLNEPNGKPWKHFKEMMPRMGEKYDIEIETISKPKSEYNTDAYFELDLPIAPAVMVGEEILVEGSDVSEEKLEGAICKQLGLPSPKPQKKRIFDRILRRWILRMVSWPIFISKVICVFLQHKA